MHRNLQSARQGGGRRFDLAVVAAGTAIGLALALGLDEAELPRIADRLDEYLLAPLIAAANAGISCF